MKKNFVSVRVAASLIAAVSCLSIYMLTPTRTDFADAKLNSLFSQCSSSVLKESYNEGSCENLYRTYANISRSSTYQYISDQVMFKLHGKITDLGHVLDLASVTDGFMARLPSGKYHTTRRSNIFDAIIGAPSQPIPLDSESELKAAL